MRLCDLIKRAKELLIKLKKWQTGKSSHWTMIVPSILMITMSSSKKTMSHITYQLPKSVKRKQTSVQHGLVFCQIILF